MSRPLDPKDAVREYSEAKQLRQPLEEDFKLSAAYCLPQDYQPWLGQTGGPPTNPNDTSAIKRLAYDNTGMLALPKYEALLQRLITPDGQRWHRLKASDNNLMRIYRVRKYYDELTDYLFMRRYNPYAGFLQAMGETYKALGVYGNGPLRVRWRPARAGVPAGFSYRALPMRDFFVLLDEDGRVWKTFFRFWLTAPQFKLKFGDVVPPKSVKAELDKGAGASNTRHFEFAHVVCPRDDYDKEAIDNRRFTHASYYIAAEDGEYVGKDGGYAGNPYLMPRVATAAGNPYGFSPAMQSLTAMSTASATKKTMLKQGQKAVDPAVLAADDGALSGRVDLRPGRVTYGAVDANGNPRVRPFETSQRGWQVAEAILADERSDVREAFLVTLFQILVDNKEMTATEVYERIAEKASLLAPTMGRTQTDMCNPLIDREILMAVEYEPDQLPVMPPELIEAKGAYETVYTSPLAKSLHAEEDAGFVRLYSLAVENAQATGDPSALDHFEVDEAFPAMAEHQNVPTAWMASPDQLKAKRDARAQKQQTEQLIQAGPAIASVTNAAMKRGGGSPALKGAA